MTEHLDDFDLEQPMVEQFPSEELDFTAPPNRRLFALLAVFGVLLIALVLGALWARRTPSEPTAPVAKKVDAKPVQQAEAGDQIVLPPLDQSDALVRQLVDRLSSHPTVAAWLTTDGLILNFVVVTSRIANGETPVAELKAIGPVPRFGTRTSRDNLYFDRTSYARYDRHAQAVASLDARGTARLYSTLKPRILEAYRRTGRPAEEFDPVLESAIVEMLKVPVVEGEIELEPKGIVYGYADPRLEQMSAAQKQLFRMGPQNVRTVQNKLREIASFLAIPESKLPPKN